MLPVLFILMLPSLIFGNGGLDDVPENILNDTCTRWNYPPW